MTTNAILQITLYFFILLILVKPLGWYMAQVYQGKPCGLNRLIGPIERVLYRVCGIHADQEMDWKAYLAAMLLFNLLGLLVVYCVQRFQAYLPLNPQGFSAVPASLAFNTAISFASNTNWQAYAGESTLSYFTQMTALTVQQFLSAATGMSLLMALIRGLSRCESKHLGNFWVDTVRGALYILLPLSFVFSLVLVSQGVIQNFKPHQTASLVQAAYETVSEQTIPMGPVASQVAIKALGSNGGGFFNTNAAHPFENPTPFTNLLEMLAILLIPAALCHTFGILVKDKRQGWAVLIGMLVLLLPFVGLAELAEQQGNPAFVSMGIEQHVQVDSPGGNMEGKETRFGIVNSALWATVTTASSNGSVNAMHDSFTPLGGLVPLWMMHLGEIVFGGVGSGLYGMLIAVMTTVFLAGLMVGRTPEYLGKKIEPYEIKMIAVVFLISPIMILVLTAIAAVTSMGASAMGNAGAHGLSEILYAFSSMGSNNGSAFAGLNANAPFYHIVGGIAIWIGRYWVAIPVLAIAGSLAKKKFIPNSSGTLATHTPLFIFLLVGVVMLLGAVSFLPVLALGPIAEHLILGGLNGL